MGLGRKLVSSVWRRNPSWTKKTEMWWDELFRESMFRFGCYVITMGWKIHVWITIAR